MYEIKVHTDNRTYINAKERDTVSRVRTVGNVSHLMQ